MAKRSGKLGRRKRELLRSDPEAIVDLNHSAIAKRSNKITFSSSQDADGTSHFRTSLVEQIPEVEVEINLLVTELRELIANLSPLNLLHRAWWTNAMVFAVTDPNEGPQNISPFALRTIDFVQSLIVSTPPAYNQKSVITDEDFARVCQLVETIFEKVHHYLFCDTARQSEFHPEWPYWAEEFYLSSAQRWVSIRGRRYQNHEIEALEDLLIDQREQIQTVFDFTPEFLIGELEKILERLTFGLGDSISKFDRVKEVAEAAKQQDIHAGLIKVGDNHDPQEIWNEILERHNLGENVRNAADNVFGVGLMNVSKNTALPALFLEELAFTPGEEQEFFSGENLPGWPIRVWPIFERPFLEVGGQFYCFDAYALFDSIYRLIERQVFSHSLEQKSRWIEARKHISEKLPKKYFKRLLPSAVIYENVNYRHPTGKSGHLNWCECDLLVKFEDHLFIVEVKGGSFAKTSPLEDFKAHTNSLETLAAKPLEQGTRFYDYISNGGDVEIFNKSHDRVEVIRKSDFQQITICAVTVDPFTEFSAQIERYISQRTNDERRRWVVSIDDLRVFADVFATPFEFINYVEERTAVASVPQLVMNDEMDHLGIYFEHGNYSLSVAETLGDPDNPNFSMLSYTGFYEIIDDHFRRKMFYKFGTPPMRQEMPVRLAEMLDVASQKSIPANDLFRQLLRLNGVWRSKIFDQIDIEGMPSAEIPRSRPLFMSGEPHFTLFCWHSLFAPRNQAIALNHAKVCLSAIDAEEIILLEVMFDADERIEDFAWRKIHKSDINIFESGQVQIEAKRLKQRRLAQHKVKQGKISKNAKCPCGSGKKFKVCCFRTIET